MSLIPIYLGTCILYCNPNNENPCLHINWASPHEFLSLTNHHYPSRTGCNGKRKVISPPYPQLGHQPLYCILSEENSLARLKVQGSSYLYGTGTALLQCGLRAARPSWYSSQRLILRLNGLVLRLMMASKFEDIYNLEILSSQSLLLAPSHRSNTSHNNITTQFQLNHPSKFFATTLQKCQPQPSKTPFPTLKSTFAYVAGTPQLPRLLLFKHFHLTRAATPSTK